MTTPTDTRSLYHSWSPAFATSPPASCQTLRNYRNTLEYGYTCEFGKEDGDPVPFSIDTACMPWVTPNVYPNPTAFFSPATACPSAWSAVSTATSGEQWVSGETGLSCCPQGFEGDGRGGCRVGNSGTFPVVECGEADAEENENRVYTAGQFPAGVTPAVRPLMLRYRASDVAEGRASPGSTGPSSGGNGSGNGGSGGGLSTGAKAAIGTAIPLFFIIGALALLMFYRRRKHKKDAMALAAKNMAEEKASPPPPSHSSHAPASDSKYIPAVAAGHHALSNSHAPPHHTPEWNTELDATEAERQKLVPQYAQYDPTSATSHGTDASELGGIARMQRKPIAPVEIDGRSVRAEVGDAYIPYRLGGTS